jgi:hypothetical protein
MDWKDALSLAFTDPGFTCTRLPDGSGRVLTHEAGHRVLASLPGRLQRAGVDQGAGPATDRCHARPGGDPHAAPVSVCPGSEA